MSLCKGIFFAPIAAKIHAKCFEKGWSEEEFKKLFALPTSRLWMTEEGMLLCSEVADEMEILTVCVLPEFRRQHIAQDLLYELFCYAKNQKIKKIFLEVAEDNEAAQKLYLSTGFKQTGRREGYYARKKAPPVDALCLTKKI